MLKVFSSFLIILGLLAVWRSSPLASPQLACTEPLAYTIGSFDRRFGLTQKDFLHSVALAEEVWETALGRELFVYAPEQAELVVNLVYDYRQEVTQELSQIEEEVEAEEESYEALEARYRTLKSQHESMRQGYEAKAATFFAHNARYESQVEAWNEGPRTSEREFAALESARRALEQEAAELEGLEEQVNALVREINGLVERLNALAEDLNMDVSIYNELGASRGDTFAGGIYISDASGTRIDIYEFENQEKLVRVLAHELGHALGLDHAADPQALMYYLNQTGEQGLTAADLSLLKARCGVD
jgi:hypothetical protein